VECSEGSDGVGQISKFGGRFADKLDGGCSKSRNRLIWFGIGAIGWALWKTRNKMAIEKKLVSSPQVVIFNMLSLVQPWRILFLNKEQKMVLAAATELKKRVTNVSSWTLTRIEREDDTRSWGNFSSLFLTQCHTNLKGWGYIFIADQNNQHMLRC
jgi:hypothetical protein